jgi:pimeloyl-ACP methyl ester carboxylesterase
MKLGAFFFLASIAWAQPAIDSAFAKFWAADSPAAASRTTADIERSGVTFDDAYKRLKAGRTYTTQPTGIVQAKNRTSDNIEHFYSINIPANYDPSKRYQVRFQLHGGVGGRTDGQPRGTGDIGQLAGAADQIYVLPYAWDTAPWWSTDQVLNLAAIVDSLKRTYNIDENRVHVAGVSDGATGSYYIAMRDTTPYASFLPLNGFIMVLANSEIDDGRSFPNNLRNKPLFAINGGKDRLYPISAVEPYTKHLMQNGVQIEYHPQPDGEHNTRWWPEMKAPFEAFATAHPRDPYPGTLTWQAADTDHSRNHWLVINRFGAVPGETSLNDLNIASDGPLFTEKKGSGRVDLARKGNTVDAQTQGVTEFTLLLSPDEFDFNQPVVVTANGKEVFRGRVQRDLKTLLKWAATDNDRTMLFGAELKITLKK